MTDPAELSITQKQSYDETTRSLCTIATNGKIATVLKAAHSEYTYRVYTRDGTNGHGLGDGSPFRFGAVLYVLSNALPEGELKVAMNAFARSYNSQLPEFLSCVKWCKTKKTHDSSNLIVELCIPYDRGFEKQVIDSIMTLENNELCA
jgi:hypothetical protein